MSRTIVNDGERATRHVAVIELSHPPLAVGCDRSGQRVCRASPALVSPPGPPLPRRPHQIRNPQGGKPIPHALIGAALRAAARGAPGGGSRAPRPPVRPSRTTARKARASGHALCNIGSGCGCRCARPPRGGLAERTAGAPRRWPARRRGGRRLSRACERQDVAAGVGELVAGVTVLAVPTRAGRRLRLPRRPRGAPSS